MPETVGSRSSVIVIRGKDTTKEDLEVTATVNSAFSFDHSAEHERCTVKKGVEVAPEVDAASNEVFSTLKGVKEVYKFPKPQMQAIQKTYQNERPVASSSSSSRFFEIRTNAFLTYTAQDTSILQAT